MKKLTLPIAVIFIMLLGLSVPASALVPQSDEYYVADYAGVLSTKTREDIIDSNHGLEYECRDAQIVVVTIEYLTDGLDSEQYAYQLFNDWGVGSRNENNGMLLLFVTEAKKAWLAVGAGISNAFTSQMAEDYFNRYVWTDFDAGRYDDAAVKMLEALFTWYAGYYGVNSNANSGAQGGGYNTQTAPESSFLGDFIVFLIIFAIVVFMIILIAVGSDRTRHRAYYVHQGIPVPRYHFWYMWRPGPYRPWYRAHRHNHWRGPRGPRGPGGGSGRPPRGPGGGGFGGFGGSGRSGRGSGGGGRTSGTGGGRSGGGFGGFGGGGRSGGGFGGFGGGGRSGGGGGFGGGAGGGGGRK